MWADSQAHYCPPVQPKSIPCKAILVPTLEDVPDPEGAAIVLGLLNAQVTTLGIDTSRLREEGEEIKERLEEFMRIYQRHMAGMSRSWSGSK